MNFKHEKPLIDKTVLHWAKKLLQKEGWESAFSIKDISDKIVDQPKLKSDQFCGNCGGAMQKLNDVGQRRRKICSDECRLNADLDFAVVTSKMFREINEYMEIKHVAKHFKDHTEGKKKAQPDYVKLTRENILSCKKLTGYTLKQLGLDGASMIGIVFNNGSKIKYLSNGKV